LKLSRWGDLAENSGSFSPFSVTVSIDTWENSGVNLLSSSLISGASATGSASVLGGGSTTIGVELVGGIGLAVDAESPVVLCPSSLSSVISSNLCREELEELLEGAAVCREQADVRAASLSSSALVMDIVVSCGVNLSVTAVKWTATRAVACISARPA
jgi:hypothetical protein